jgi:hypothetical protein
MGYGDFKLFAALGAWFGWQALIPLILLASVAGAIVGIALKYASQLREGAYVPFGPISGHSRPHGHDFWRPIHFEACRAECVNKPKKTKMQFRSTTSRTHWWNWQW